MTPERAMELLEPHQFSEGGSGPLLWVFRAKEIILAACREDTESLRAENAKLREALRRVAIVGYELGVGTWCRCCHEWWLSAAPEKHKPGCLAAQEGER